MLPSSAESIDTAHAYGPETSERLIAEALHPYPLDLLVATKGGEDVLAICEGAGIMFLPWFPLGAGVLARAGELQAVASAHGATAAQVAIAWLLQRSPALLPIPGTGSIAHLDENVAAAALRLSEAELRRLSPATGSGSP